MINITLVDKGDYIVVNGESETGPTGRSYQASIHVDKKDIEKAKSLVKKSIVKKSIIDNKRKRRFNIINKIP